jgi:hypothetical protein
MVILVESGPSRLAKSSSKTGPPEHLVDLGAGSAQSSQERLQSLDALAIAHEDDGARETRISRKVLNSCDSPVRQGRLRDRAGGRADQYHSRGK